MVCPYGAPEGGPTPASQGCDGPAPASALGYPLSPRPGLRLKPNLSEHPTACAMVSEDKTHSSRFHPGLDFEAVSKLFDACL
ncbi:MAG: hypothetical protein AMXMBFR13_32790 [Phycisphaerae bacterium]